MTSLVRRPLLARPLTAAALAAGLALPASSGLSAQTTARPGGAASATHVMVHVRAHDAKLVGSAVGGALVTITDVATGRVLARGRTEGGTGDTRRIMAEPHQRGERLFDTPGAAGFLADVDIRRPTVVEISASGPGSPEDATMCGCPTEPGGMWNADDIQIVARLLDGDRVLDQAPLSFTGTTSQYSGPLTPPAAGSYTLEVLAIDTADANAGRAHRAITAR